MWYRAISAIDKNLRCGSSCLRSPIVSTTHSVGIFTTRESTLRLTASGVKIRKVDDEDRSNAIETVSMLMQKHNERLHRND